MNIRSQLVCVWTGFAFAALGLLGFLLPDFIPPISPALSADEVATIYEENALPMRVGILMIMTAGGLMISFAAAIAVQLKRIEGEHAPFAMTELGSGSVTCMIFVFAGVFWTGAAYRPDHDPELTRLLNDIGWITMLMTFAPFIVQNISLGLCILSDKREEPIFPRGIGFYNLWVAVLFVPGGMLTFFKTGPFAWDGLFVWWIPFSVFFTWYLFMSYIMLGVVKKQARSQESATS